MATGYCFFIVSVFEILLAIGFIVVVQPVKMAYTEAREDAQAVSNYLSGCSDFLTTLDSEDLKESYAWIEDRATSAQ